MTWSLETLLWLVDPWFCAMLDTIWVAGQGRAGSEIQWWVNMIPQELPRHTISQDWLSIIYLITMSRPSKLLSQNIIFTGCQFCEDVRPWLHPSKDVRAWLMIGWAIDKETVWGLLHASKTLLQENWLFQVIKWNGTTAACERCGRAWSGPWARYRRRRHSSIQVLRWPWVQKRASNGWDRTWYVPWNMDLTVGKENKIR